jgi:hypothetical protein
MTELLWRMWNSKLAHSGAVKVETAPKETPKLQQAMMPVPSCRPTWPSPVAVEKVLIKYNTQLLTFHPKCVPEQFIVQIIVEAGIPVTPSAQIWHSLVQIHFSHSNPWSNINRRFY